MCVNIFKVLRENEVNIRVWRSLVSRLNGVQEAAGSNPVTRTKKTVDFERNPRFFLTFPQTFSGFNWACLPLFYHFPDLRYAELVGQGCCDAAFPGRVQVGVDVGGHLDIRVS